MSYHVRNSSHVTDHFLCMLRSLCFILVLSSLHVLRCVLLEIALNAGSACVGRRGPPRGPAASCRRLAVHPAFQNTVTDNIRSYIWRSICGSDRIVIFCVISYRIYRFFLWLYRAITTKQCVKYKGYLMLLLLFYWAIFQIQDRIGYL